MNLKHITDKQLLKDIKQLAEKERKITSEFLQHLKEIERRKLFSEIGYPSLFKYLTHELGFSEPGAMRRINASRILRELPEVQEKYEKGLLNLSHLSKAHEKFRMFNIKDSSRKKEILTAIERTSTRDCEKVLEEMTMPNNVIPFIPQQTIAVTIHLSKDNFKLFEDVRDLLAHHKLNKNDLFGRIFTSAINDLKSKKFKTDSKAPAKESKTRYIPTGLRKLIFERDKVCQKCGGTFALQIDHIKPYSLGGTTTQSNLRLLCRSCNQRARISSNLHLP